jgi:hypothetical protein
MWRNGRLFVVRGAASVLFGCIALACAASARPGVAAPLGVVVSAQGAQISQVAAANGTSLYAGDTLSTDASGSLHVRFGRSQLVLGPASTAKIAQAEHAVAAILQHGILRFSAAGAGLEFQALDHVVVRAQADTASGELAVIGPSEFQIACTRGALIVDIDGAQRVVAESTSYDVTLKDAPDYEDNTKHAGRRKKLGVWIPISAILIATGVGLYLAALSCSKF